MDDLLNLEREGWMALSSGLDKAYAFYAEVLAEDAMMIFPGDLVIIGEKAILNSLGTQPWDSFSIDEVSQLALTNDASALVYKVTAKRKDSQPYIARITSVYVQRDQKWQLILHQQTPISSGYAQQ